MRIKGIVTLLLICAIAGCAAKVPAPIFERVVIMKDEEAATYSYVVRSGDTIFAIAKLHGLTVDDVAAANGIEPPYLIKPGQVLFIKTGVPEIGSAGSPKNRTSESTQTQAGKHVGPDVADQPEVATSSASLVPEPIVVKPKKSSRVPIPDSGRYSAGWQWPVAASPLRDYSAARKGIDFVLSEGEQIVAASSGQVIYAGSGTLKYKHLIIIQSKDAYLAAYEFNTDLNVRQNTIVEKGDVLATISNTGSSNDAHRRFHFGIWSGGSPVNPKTVILK